MTVPSKRNPDNPADVRESDEDLSVLNEFCIFLQSLYDDFEYNKCAVDAYKVITCLRFIKINQPFITYAFDHRLSYDPRIHTYKQDVVKGVLRDFDDTSFHLNGYNDTQKQKCWDDLRINIAQIEFACKEVTRRGRPAMLEFVQQFKFENSVGCLDERLASPVKYIGNLITATTPHLDELFSQLMQQVERVGNLSEVAVYESALDFFKPFMYRPCRVGQSDEKILTWHVITDYLSMLAYDSLDCLPMIRDESTPVHRRYYLSTGLIEDLLVAENFNSEQIDPLSLDVVNQVFKKISHLSVSSEELKAFRSNAFQLLSKAIENTTDPIKALEKLLWARQQIFFTEHRSSHWFARIGRTKTAIKIDGLLQETLQKIQQERSQGTSRAKSSIVQGFSVESAELCNNLLAQEVKRLQAETILAQNSFFRRVPRKKIEQLITFQTEIKDLLDIACEKSITLNVREPLAQKFAAMIELQILDRDVTQQLNTFRRSWELVDNSEIYTADRSF